MITEQQNPRMHGGVASPALDTRIKEALGFAPNPADDASTGRPARTYAISPRPESVGGGRTLTLFDDDEAVGGGVFPAGEDGYDEAMEEGESWGTLATLENDPPSQAQGEIPAAALLVCEPPPMSAVLRTVLEVVEELEAHGLVVESVDIPWPDEPSLGLAEYTDLDGDEHHRFPFTINGETRIMENRHMVYRGIYIDWTCKAEGVEAVEEAAHA
jgi:hypothetical protein